MKKIISNVIYALSVLFLIWFAVSFVGMNISIAKGCEPPSWNLFELLF